MHSMLTIDSPWKGEIVPLQVSIHRYDISVLLRRSIFDMSVVPQLESNTLFIHANKGAMRPLPSTVAWAS